MVREPECIECGDPFNPRRRDLGYYTCLECGDVQASKEALHKAKCTAPAYNKGGYMYIASKSMARDVGR